MLNDQFQEMSLEAAIRTETDLNLAVDAVLQAARLDHHRDQAKQTPLRVPPGHGSAVPGTSTFTSIGIGSKPEFELIYKRPAAPPRK